MILRKNKAKGICGLNIEKSKKSHVGTGERFAEGIKTPVFLLLLAVLIFAGCRAPVIPPEGTSSPGTASDPGGLEEYKITEKPFSPWEERTMEELIKVGGLTSVPAGTMVYDVRDLGVNPGGGDASESVKAAVENVISKGGGILYFPSGRYNIGTALELSGEGRWICFLGDVDGSTTFVFARKFDGGTGFKVAKDNTHFSFITFEDSSPETVTVSVEANGCSFYGCSFTKKYARAEKTCLEISGSFDTVRQCSFWAENKDTCFVEFTKYPGRRAYGNVMCDVHFGGEFSKTVLISSRDGDGAQEDLTFFRNLFLIQSEPNVEVRTVNGLTIANNMLDAAVKAVCIAPEGIGVFNVEIRDNYIGARSGGVRFDETGTIGANISIHDNYMWTPESVNVLGKNYSDITVKNNYFVVGAGSAVYMRYARGAVIKDNLTANIGSSDHELKVLGCDDRSEIEETGFGSVSVPSKKDPAENVTVPAVPSERPSFEPAPEITGDRPVEFNGKYVNVKDIGAKGDGVTDDTESIKESIEKAKSKNGTVYFPEGTYLVKETLSIPKNDAVVLRFKGDGRDVSVIVGDGSLDGSIFDIGLKYNCYMYDIGFRHDGNGSCVDALFVKAFDCSFEGSEGSAAPLLWFHGSNCWAVRCDFFTKNSESYCLSYTRSPGEISINNFITDNTFRGPGKGVLTGDGSTVNEGRCEGLKIIGNEFKNTGETAVEVYEILHVNIAYNTFEGQTNAIFLSNLGHGPDGIYIDHNDVDSKECCVTSGTVPGGGDYISMVVIHANVFKGGAAGPIGETVPFNKKMIHDVY